jgi:hypothetical protein
MAGAGGELDHPQMVGADVEADRQDVGPSTTREKHASVPW